MVVAEEEGLSGKRMDGKTLDWRVRSKARRWKAKDAGPEEMQEWEQLEDRGVGKNDSEPGQVQFSLNEQLDCFSGKTSTSKYGVLLNVLLLSRYYQ